MQKVDGVFPEAGVQDVIMHSDLAGVLAHEAIGHTTEADLVLGGSVAADYLNQQVADPKITLIDFANTAFGKITPVPVFVDDEGTKAEDVSIIKNVILKSFIKILHILFNLFLENIFDDFFHKLTHYFIILEVPQKR